MNAENEHKDDSSEAKVADADATLKLEATNEASAAASVGAAEPPAKTGTREDRRGWVENVSQTFSYLDKVSRDKSLPFRSTDKLTTKILIGAFVLAIGFAALPFFEMNAIAAVAYILADIALFVAIGTFVVSRFGIIRAMDPRHAMVCWHLMVGTGLLTLVIGFNIVAVVVVIMMRERLQLLFPGG